MNKELDAGVWEHGRGYSKVYTNSYEQKQRLVKLEGVKLCNKYTGKDTAWDFVFPNSSLKSVLNVLATYEASPI